MTSLQFHRHASCHFLLAILILPCMHLQLSRPVSNNKTWSIDDNRLAKGKFHSLKGLLLPKYHMHFRIVHQTAETQFHQFKVHPRNTKTKLRLRNTKTDLAVLSMRTGNGQKAFSYRGTKVWNKFNNNIKEAPSVYSFKSRLRQLGYENL